jgi:tRNA(fMet)-specific endonuclease VapC
MTAFDTDVLTEILQGSPRFVERAAAIPGHEQTVPIVVFEEIMRGRLNVIRQAEAGSGKVTIAHAYELLEKTFSDFRRIQILLHTPQAEALYQRWRQQGIRIATHDLRIAAGCVVQSTKLVSRNRKDFDGVPGLNVEFWD